MCAGDGEWALSQAQAHPEMNWVANEVRGDRIHQIASRMRSGVAPNLALLGADAALALAHHTRRKSFEAIYVNFPEPPPDHGNADEYLLNADFLTRAHSALRPGGLGLFIVSDNPHILDTVAQSLHGLMHASPPLAFVSRTGVEGGQPRAYLSSRAIGDAAAALISEGVPEGFGVEGYGSYFDRLWSSRSKQRRYHIHVVRTA